MMFDDKSFGATVEEAIQYGVSQGFAVIRSDPEHLLLDLDSPEAWAIFSKNLPFIESRVDSWEQWNSKSGNTHVYIKLYTSTSILERIAIQAALGSDGTRELGHLQEVADGEEEPCLLFKPMKVKL